MQEALRLVFAKFAELQSVRQAHVWLRDDGIALPVASHSAAEGAQRRLEVAALQDRPQHPDEPDRCRGACLWTHNEQVSVENGRKRVKRGLRRPLSDWDVLLKDQHEGYITWSEFERNQQVIADPQEHLRSR